MGIGFDTAKTLIQQLNDSPDARAELADACNALQASIYAIDMAYTKARDEFLAEQQAAFDAKWNASRKAAVTASRVKLDADIAAAEAAEAKP